MVSETREPDTENGVTKPVLTFSDVAGYEKLKEQLRKFIIEKKGNDWEGLFLYGPPGCGKTYIVKAAAGEQKAGFIDVKIRDLVDKNVKNTEKNVHEVFELARKNAPCILFFDEIDAKRIVERPTDFCSSCGQRLPQREEYMKMAVNQMFYEMDGIKAHNENILWIATTNAPWDADPALLRSGRFSKAIYVSEPDLASREEILKMHGKKKSLDNIDFKYLAKVTDGYACIDLKGVVFEASDIPWKEKYVKVHEMVEAYIKKGISKEKAQLKAESEVKMRPITMDDFKKALDKRTSSLTAWYIQAKKQLNKFPKEEKVIFKEFIKRINRAF